MTRNNDNAVKPVLVDLGGDWQLYDRLPKKVRLALTESPYEYSSQQIWDAFRGAKNSGVFRTDEEAWDSVVRMIPMNDRRLAEIERQ